MKYLDRERGQIILTRFVGACIRLFESPQDERATEDRKSALAEVRSYLIDEKGAFGFGNFPDAAAVGSALAQTYSTVDNTEMYVISQATDNVFVLGFNRRERMPDLFLDQKYRNDFWNNVRSFMRSGEPATLLPVQDEFGWETGFDRNNMRALSLRVPADKFDLMGYALSEVQASIRADQMGWKIQLDDLRGIGAVGITIYNDQEPI